MWSSEKLLQKMSPNKDSALGLTAWSLISQNNLLAVSYHVEKLWHFTLKMEDVCILPTEDTVTFTLDKKKIWQIPM